jgi:hypothetical protein
MSGHKRPGYNRNQARLAAHRASGGGCLMLVLAALAVLAAVVLS